MNNGSMGLLLQTGFFLPLAALFAVFCFAGPVRAEDPSYFEHNYAKGGIVRPETSRIAPEVKAPERRADQMLQTEAVPEPRDKIPTIRPTRERPPGFPGRFVTRQGGTEEREVPDKLGEVGTNLP